MTSSKADMLGFIERRQVASPDFEFRSQGPKTVRFTGYASVFDTGYDVHGGASRNGWTEFVTRSAFKRTLGEKPDVVLLINHEGLPLARTKPNTLRLSTDSTGLLAQADLDMNDYRVPSLVASMERGDIDQMSFAFQVRKQTWNEAETERFLDEVSLHNGDVSIVTYGANPHTSVGVRSAVELLANMDQKQLAELRSMSDDVDRAMNRLLAVRDAADGDPNPGDIKYADQKNEKYPIDTAEHVRAAWSYINMPKNQAGYSDAELSEIKGRIKAAAQRFGIAIAEDDIKDSLRSLLARVKRSSSGILPDPSSSALAQAIHDMCADAGAACGTETQPDDDPMDDYKLSAGPAPEKRRQTGSGMSLMEARRLCRPQDSPDPMTVGNAKKMAS